MDSRDIFIAWLQGAGLIVAYGVIAFLIGWACNHWGLI